MASPTGDNTGSHTPPWTLRVYDALPGTTVQIGLVFMLLLLGVFFAGRAFYESISTTEAQDLRIAITQILLTAYIASAYAQVLITARRTTQAIAPVAQHLPQWPAHCALVSRYPMWLLPLVGLGNFLLIGVTATIATTPSDTQAWAWHTWNYDVAWHRSTTLLFVWWIGCFCFVTVTESLRLSRLSNDIESVDLLKLQDFDPLVHQGHTNALLVIGVVTILSLLGVDARYWPMLVLFWVAFIGLAWLGLMLPLRTIRLKIRAAKQAELDWCQQRVRQARDALKAGEDTELPLSELVAYQRLVLNIRNWPFDNPNLLRFLLYLLIPLGSWLGGAFVERGLDWFLG